MARKRTPKDNEDGRQNDYIDDMTISLLMLFASCKYHERERNGPREPGLRPDDLRRAAALIVDGLGAAWRAGYRWQDAAKEVYRVINERNNLKENPCHAVQGTPCQGVGERHVAGPCRDVS